ncbi:MAG: pantoate--beta-alanine ligase [Gemmatimonadales bacterium]|nr:MAG: pantoate--beta-alanine ligase [Gemmatimonadales bacterium]
MNQQPPPGEFTTVAGIRAWVTAQRAGGSRIGFVPTMGSLHEGHLALVDAARAVSDVVVMSIFVNPLQFGPSEDFSRYPRDLPRDRTLAASRGVDAIFLPDVSVMYQPGSDTRVVPGPGADRWEGEVRPGHFTGVLTVVAKLFHLVTPDVAVFGQKDAQQAALIRRMVRDLDWPVALVVAPTTREPSGLALSSRNSYLSAEDRLQAVGLSAALRAAHEAWRGGETAGDRLVAVARRVLEVYPGVSPEYISAVEPEALAPVETVGAGCLMLVAARVGSTRLIDNIVFGEGIP